MRAWTDILPWFVVKWYARRYCERFMMPGTDQRWIIVGRDTVIRDKS